jgi:murein DD-endopeptidase MepM/ murein hydrolase activator NlpD
MLNFVQKKILGYATIFLAGIVIVPAVKANRLETFLLDKSRNRIEFTTQNQVQPIGQIIENPTRLVIDLPNAAFTGPTVRRNNIGTIVQSLRVGKLDPVGTRLVIEFAPDFNANLLDEQPLKLEAISPSRWSIQFPSAIATSLQNTITSFIMPTVGGISSPFGWRINPVTGKRQLHKGIDIAAPIGAPILAAATGMVNDAGWDDGGYGNFVELRHRDGSLTLYAHTNRVLVAKGQEITQGQIIAEVGNTGRSTGPHLHFEVQIGRQAVDPTPFIHSDLVILNLASR